VQRRRVGETALVELGSGEWVNVAGESGEVRFVDALHDAGAGNL